MKIRRILLIFCITTSSLHARSFFSNQSDLNYRFGFINEIAYHKLNATPLNGNNAHVPQLKYYNYATANIFLNWKSLTTSLKGSASYNDRDNPSYKGIIREIFFDSPVGKNYYFTCGRKILKWSTGYSFAPTGVLDPPKNPADPSDRLDQYQGRQIIAFDFFQENTSITLVYANEIRFEDGIKGGENQAALKYYKLIGGTDLSFIGHWREYHKLQIGFNTATTLNSHLELHTDFIAHRGSDKQYHQVLDSPDYKMYFMDPYRARYKNSQALFYKLLLGTQYTFTSGLSLMAEYYYNREGLTKNEWKRWRNFALFHEKRMSGQPPDVRSISNFYNALLTLDENGSMRHYAFVRFYLPTQKIGYEIINIANLVDYSGSGIAMLTCFMNSNFSIWLRALLYYGKRDSEFGTLFSRAMLQLGAKASF